MPRLLKRVFGVLGGLVAALLLAGLVLSIIGASISRRTFEIDESALLSAVVADEITLARGAHLAKILSCTECHGEDLSGLVYIDAPPFRVVGSNLTPGRGGAGGSYSPRDWDRAIRHGVLSDGRAVIPVMPSQLYHSLSDEDTNALIAYLMSLDPVDTEHPDTALRFLGKVLVALPALDYSAAVADPGWIRSPAPRPGPTAEYGRYLASVTCVDCHGKDLRGAPHPDPSGPPGPDLQAAGSWTPEQFAAAMRSGLTPEGKHLNTRYMPWASSYTHLTDMELTALQAHIAAETGR